MPGHHTEQELVRVHIRWMIRRDMPEVFQIEQTSFEHPWTEEDFLRHLRQRNCIGMVAELGDRILGYMVYELHRTELRLLDLAVHPHYRRRGIGSQLLQKLVGKLTSHRRTRISAHVRETNLPAQLFLRAQGFYAVRVLRDHFADTGEDAYLMQFTLDGDHTLENWTIPANHISSMDSSVE